MQHLDVLLGRYQLRLELLHLVLVQGAVELEQGLAFLDPGVGFNQYIGHQCGVIQAGNKLNGVLHHSGLGGIGGDETQADQENDQQVQSHKRRDDAPGYVELQPFELEKYQPAENDVAE